MTADSQVPGSNEPTGPEDNAPHPEAADATPATKPQRPAVLVFTQAVLLLQGFVALFATLVLWSFARNELIDVNQWAVLASGLVLMLVLLYSSGKQSKNWGRILGWVLQIPLLAAVVLEPAVGVIGVIFLVLWIMALRIGSRIDRERKERDQAAQAVVEADGPDAKSDADRA